jgi:alpha-beta hydrolase superfamily lysophospholipase
MIQAAYFLGSPFMRSIPRAYFDASGDREYREYLDFMENHDPLQVQEVPLRWVKALLDWNQRISNYKVIPKKINVIQGDADTVLDWKANLAILQERFSDVSPAMIPGGKHILFHETEKRKYLVFEKIWECLSEH